MLARMKRPRVFLSFAGPDRSTALLLAKDLLAYGIESFIDSRDIPPAASLLQSISQEMAESDYCVLLWSQHCADRPYVWLELEMAYARELNERRKFLFVVRLDRSPVPLLLSVRRYLNGFGDLPAVARDLATHWRADLEAGTPVFPQPAPASQPEPAGIAVLIRNVVLGMSHVVNNVAPDATGDQLLTETRRALALPELESQLRGALEIRFSYRLLWAGSPVSDKPLAELGIVDADRLDLEILVQVRGPDGPLGEHVYRGPEDEPTGVSEESIHSLVHAAFAHLLP
ncbi:MAG: toll/interleukin-1 receptor domain-containing protein [Labedaea sp.]